MKFDEISEPPLQYGDEVTTKNQDSRLTGLVGKIIDINSISAKVKFEEFKKPQLIMLNALEKL